LSCFSCHVVHPTTHVVLLALVALRIWIPIVRLRRFADQSSDHCSSGSEESACCALGNCWHSAPLHHTSSYQKPRNHKLIYSLSLIITGGSNPLVNVSTADISVLHSREVVHFHHNSCSPKSPRFARPLNTSFCEWRGVHYEAFTKIRRKLNSLLELH
jgi:hypothetical protein